jgi:hypothetical protein
MIKPLRNPLATFSDRAATYLAIRFRAHLSSGGGAVRVRLLPLASLGFLLTTFPILRASSQRAVPPDEIRAKESAARLVLQRTNSVFSLELSSSRSATNLPAIFSAKLLSPDDKLLAEASVSVTLTPAPRRFELTFDWIPRYSLNDAATARLFYEVRPTAAATPESTIPQANGVLSPLSFRLSLFAFRSPLSVRPPRLTQNS